ncbi:unnamed protein product [Callosobruchus maculatus]|uniref:Uncharacterized protein n=1 Tax=Callosobruchus maculatus TaxID=64391 RepID=A0A653CDU5_CALMS|nr:unnamed protein product [Callosobruchus maculatus]
MWSLQCLFLISLATAISCEEVRLDDLDPKDAQQIIEQQDQSLSYAPKVASNVPAVRFLGNEPHHVQEDIYQARQYHGQDGLGGYLYGYNVPDIAKTEKKKAGGDLRGAYNYIAGDGQEIKVEYWDDGTGFHQIDNVPKILPKQVEDSPDVKAAKAKFFARWNEEAERNLHPVEYPYNSEGQYKNPPLSPSVQQQLIQHQQQIPQNVQYQTSQGQYRPGQYPQQQPGNPNQLDYSGQYSEQKSVYSQPQTGNNPYRETKSAGNPYVQSGGYDNKPQPTPNPYVQSTGYGGQPQPTPNPYVKSGGYGGQPQPTVNPYVQSGGYGGQAQPTVQPGAYNRQTKSSGNPYGQGETNGEGETTGPPRGFFYSFDYPVGIIVNKGEVVKRGTDVKDVYNENKEKFEAQLQQGHSDGSQTRYLYTQN